MERTYTLFTITFEDGTTMTVSERDGFESRLRVYNWVCRAAETNKKIRDHGPVQSIECSVTK